MRSIWLIAFTSLLFSICSFANADEGDIWLRRADDASGQIGDPELADRAFFRLTEIYIQRGEIARVKSLLPLIKKPEVIVQARIGLAGYFSENGNDDNCVEQLILANTLAGKSGSRSDLIEAFLDHTGRPGLAVTFLRRQKNVTDRETENLCEHLAKRGFVDDALVLVDEQPDAKRATTLTNKIAFASAEAGLIDETQRVNKRVEQERTQQYVWMRLAKALLKQKKIADAKTFAAKVTDSYIRRTNQQTLKRINNTALPQPSGSELLEQTKQLAPDKRNHQWGRVLEQQTREQDPDLADQTVAAMVADAKANPVAPSTGQFGPSNAQIQLNSALSQYAGVAHLYHKAGNHEQAKKKLLVAEEAIVSLVEQNAFMAWMGLLKLNAVQVVMNDVESIKRTTRKIPAELWALSAEKFVEKLIEKGELDAAKDVAALALDVRSPMGGSNVSTASVVSLFVNAGKTDEAFDVLKQIDPGKNNARACEVTATAIIRSGQSVLLKSWLDQLAPSQQVHLCIGAALASSKSD